MLDSSAKLSDIILLLQESEGINQKAELKSNLTAQDVEVLDADDMATLVSKVLDIKRFKLGTTDITSSDHSITNATRITPIKLEFYSKALIKNASLIQVLKNGTTNIFNTAIRINDITNDESIFIDTNENLEADTDYKIVLSQGCLKDKLNNEFNTMEYNFHTNSIINTWYTNSSGLNVARAYLAGCGSQNAGLSFGGSGPSQSAITEKFNDIVWSLTGAMLTTRDGLAGCGTQNAGLNFGGYSSAPYTELFNGTSWLSASNMNTGRQQLAGCGTQLAGLSFGGHSGSVGDYLKTTELFNGSTWSSTGGLSVGKDDLAGCGTQSAGLSFGGYTASSSYVATAEKFNGTTWSTTGSMNTARYFLAGCGTQSDGLSFGGQMSGGNSAITEKFNGTSWGTTGVMNTARYGLAGCGLSSSSGLSFGGYNSDYSTITEKFIA